MTIYSPKKAISIILSIVIALGISGCASDRLEETEPTTIPIVTEATAEPSIETTIPTETETAPTETGPEESKETLHQDTALHNCRAFCGDPRL